MKFRSFFRIPYIHFAMVLGSIATVTADSYHFNFEEVNRGEGTQVDADTAYNSTRGYGFLKINNREQKSRVFAVNVEQGNYDVTVRFGSESQATSTTIKAESRRLMLEQIETEPGEFITKTFTVNVRQPEISSDRVTSLNSRETKPVMSPEWDNLLTLEINGKQPGVSSIQIVPAKEAVTVFIAGDSTVTNQQYEPWAGWGQMLPRFFEQGVAISNQAESGLALFSFERQKRLEKVLSMAKKGDYLFIQFGHNDQKDSSEGAGPFTSYKNNLERYVKAAREHGVEPVLVTPVERRRWKNSKPQTTLEDYADAVRQVGKEMKVPIIDMHAMSLQFYAALGEDTSTRAFVHYPENTFPGQNKRLRDDTHHNSYGGYELARCMVEGIKKELPELAEKLTKDAGSFDPSAPDSPDEFALPLSPSIEIETPAGS